MAEGLSLHGRKERLEAIITLGTDELRAHQAELEAQLATANEQNITRWQEAIPPMLARVAFELAMRELETALADGAPASELVSV